METWCFFGVERSGVWALVKQLFSYHNSGLRFIARLVWRLFNSGRSLRKTYKSPLKTDRAPLKADRAPLETDNPPPETTKLPLETDKPPLETDKTPPKTTELPVQRQLQGGAGHRAIMPARFFFCCAPLVSHFGMQKPIEFPFSRTNGP